MPLAIGASVPIHAGAALEVEMVGRIKSLFPDEIIGGHTKPPCITGDGMPMKSSFEVIILSGIHCL
jgi:hypothetical protein